MEEERRTTGYWLVKQLFKCLISTIYNNVVVEGLEYMPKDGEPCIVCANHGNSLTDPAVLLSHIPTSARTLIRLTAKDTHLNQRTLSSFLIGQTGAVPIMRPKDHKDNPDFVREGNIQAFTKLIEALHHGSCVLLFPEGISRYHPSISTLKTGTARIALETLKTAPSSQNEEYRLTILPVTITYLHRFHFRSNVLVRFSQPLILSSKTRESELPSISQLTNAIETRLKDGGIDASSWKDVRIAHTARKIYSPCNATGDGRITLGEYVRLTQLFVRLLSSETQGDPEFKRKLRMDLESYATTLKVLGLKDHRLANQGEFRSYILLYRLVLRLIWAFVLAILAAPGLIIASPVLAISKQAERRFRKTDKPLWDVLDEVMQTKALTGWITFLTLYSLLLFLTAPFAFITSWLIPAWLWLTLRWSQDLTSAVRSALSLCKLLSLRWTDKPMLHCLKIVRSGLYERILQLLTLNGFENPEDWELTLALIEEGAEGQRGRKDRRMKFKERFGYFSVKKRRVRDWNEVLRLVDLSDFDDEVETLDT